MWLEQCERGEVLSRHRKPYKPSALRGYRQDFDHYILPEFGALRLSDVTADDIQGLVDRLVGSGLSGSKVRNVHTALAALYRRHRRQVLIDPTDGLDLPDPGRRRERVAQPAEAARLLAALPDSDRALWAVAIYAGLRLGELRALRAGNVTEASIQVEHGWDVKAGEIAPKSSAGVRHVPVPGILWVELVAYMKQVGRSGGDLLFGRSASAPFTDSYMRKRARTAWVAAAVGSFLRGETGSLEPIGFHECRHSYSSYLDAAGVSEVRAVRYMGHSNSSMRACYTHQLDAQLAEDARRLDEYLAGASAGRVVPLSAVEALAG